MCRCIINNLLYSLQSTYLSLHISQPEPEVTDIRPLPGRSSRLTDCVRGRPTGGQQSPAWMGVTRFVTENIQTVLMEAGGVPHLLSGSPANSWNFHPQLADSLINSTGDGILLPVLSAQPSHWSSGCLNHCILILGVNHRHHHRYRH